MKKMRNQFHKLLGIHAVSGKEKPVRDYLKPILKKSMDTVIVDDYGNLLAEKVIGNGNGAVVMLSAHMDTVESVSENMILFTTREGEVSTMNGTLGADDRAGIAIILEVLRQMEKSSFNGILKIAFTREEETGCLGSMEIDPQWYSNVNLCIVVDRKGNRDIVTGCMSAFCSDAVGLFFEKVSAMINMHWVACQGGTSDACTFSDNGINTVNLSAGFYNEHTKKEYALLGDMEDTVKLIIKALSEVNNYYQTFGEVPEENKWVKSPYEGDVYAEEFDAHGNVFIYEVDEDLSIQQGENEIMVSKKTMKSLFDQVKDFF